jgi:hypothetical protein
MVGLAVNDPGRIAIINKCTTNVWKNEDEETKSAVYAERENEKKAKERLKKSGKSSSPEEFASYVGIHFLKLNWLLTNYMYIQCTHHIAGHYRRILQRNGDAHRVVVHRSCWRT